MQADAGCGTDYDIPSGVMATQQRSQSFKTAEWHAEPAAAACRPVPGVPNVRTFVAAMVVALSLAGCGPASAPADAPYATYDSFEALAAADYRNRFDVRRVTVPTAGDQPADHGFFFYNCQQRELLQFDPTGRYMLALRVFFEGRDVRPDDRAEVGIVDLQNANEWTLIGESTAWNWQQGNRLQWVPGSDEEIAWNDRSDDGTHFVSRIYNTRTGQQRTLPRPIYTISPDGKTALTHDFERMKHGGTDYVGIKDKFDGIWAPDAAHIWKMNMATGEHEPVLSVAEMVQRMYPADHVPNPAATLYFFREGFNPSGSRFIFFVKDATPGERARTEGYSMSIEGGDIRYLYKAPSHHFWIDDETVMDNGWHTPPGGDEEVRGYFIFTDDGSGEPKELIYEAPNGHITLSRDGEWILTDTYNMDGYIHLYMYHLASERLVPLAKLESHLKREQVFESASYYRIDLHPRFSPDGRTVSIDSSHEGLGRQVYLIDVGEIMDNPPMAAR